MGMSEYVVCCPEIEVYMTWLWTVVW